MCSLPAPVAKPGEGRHQVALLRRRVTCAQRRPLAKARETTREAMRIEMVAAQVPTAGAPARRGPVCPCTAHPRPQSLLMGGASGPPGEGWGRALPRHPSSPTPRAWSPAEASVRRRRCARTRRARRGNVNERRHRPGGVTPCRGVSTHSCDATNARADNDEVTRGATVLRSSSSLCTNVASASAHETALGHRRGCLFGFKARGWRRRPVARGARLWRPSYHLCCDRDVETPTRPPARSCGHGHA